MKKKITEAIISVLIICLLSAGLLSYSAFGLDGTEYEPDNEDVFEELEKTLGDIQEGRDYEGFIFSLNEEISDDAQAALKERIENGEITPLEYADNVYVAGSLDVIQDSLDSSEIENIEPDYMMELFDDAPNDPYYSEQYNLETMNVPAVWDMEYEGQDTDGAGDDIVIAVIDSGLMSGHEDMDYSRVLPGRDFTAETVSDNVEDAQNHGTFVCGIIAAVKNNSIGITGILQQVKLLPLKAFGGKKTGTSIVINAIAYAISQKDLYDKTNGSEGLNICVINMSFGGSDESAGEETSLEKTCKDAIDSGIILVSAAGNINGKDIKQGDATYPAQYTMGVASTDSTDAVASGSQWLSADNGEGYENKVWVAAPGVNLKSLSTTSSKYRTGGGTSYACPEVSALAAVCKSIDNDMTQAEFMQLLKDTSHYMDSDGDPEDHSGDINGQDIRYGWGIIDYKAAVEKLLEEDSGTSSETEESPETEPSGETEPETEPESAAEPETKAEPEAPDGSETQDEPQTEAPGPDNSEPETSDDPGNKPDDPGLFPDVSDPSSPIYKPVYWAAEKGIVRGYSNGYFGPEDSCSREQFVVMLWRLAGRPAASRNVEFSDVGSERSTYRALQWAVENDIIRGFDDGSFRPQDTVTRVQTVIMLWRMAGRPEAGSQAYFDDITPSSTGYAAICWGSSDGIIKGFADGTFRPLNECLRQEMVIFLYRFQRYRDNI